MAGVARGALRALACLLFVACIPAFAADALSARQRSEDFDALWRAVDARYAYFDPPLRAAWLRARTAGSPRAAAARTREEFVAALEGTLAELRDDHAALSERSRRGPRRIPFETDVWPAWKKGTAVIEAVRTFGDADVAGLHPGEVATSVDGVPIEKAVRTRLGAGIADARARDWALRQEVAGPAHGGYRIEAQDGPIRASHAIERPEGKRSTAPPVMGRRIGYGRDIGYLRVRIGADDERVAAQFAAALHSVADTRALIVDLRDTAAPGSRVATVAILAHFAPAETTWQLRKPRGGAAVADRVAPSGEPYRSPVVVLVDRWTAGEGEALAAGLVAVCRARVVGTASAGLRGELGEVRLPHSGLVAKFPVERTLLPDGRPRESLRPALAVDLAAPRGGPGDPILYEALKLLER